MTKFPFRATINGKPVLVHRRRWGKRKRLGKFYVTRLSERTTGGEHDNR